MTVRLRLTLLFGGVFLLAGLALVTIEHGLVQQTIESRSFLPPPPLPGAPPPPPQGAGPPERQLPPPGQFAPPPNDPMQRTLRQYQHELELRILGAQFAESLVALGIVGAAMVWLAWILAGAAMRPVVQMTAVARRLSERTLHERLPVAGPRDELRDLAETFNEMLDRLDRAFEAQRRFAMNVSHELRTPLTVQRTVAEVALADPSATPAELREALEQVRHAVDEGEELIEALLMLARAERGIQTQTIFDPSLLVEESLERYADPLDAKHLSVRRQLDTLSVRGDERLISRAVDNLIRNAVLHNLEGGWIEVETGASGGATFIRVANGGPQLSEATLETLFEPFGGRRRGRSRGSGLGLGLSIVRAIAVAHGGNVSLAALPEGGLAATIELRESAGDSA